MISLVFCLAAVALYFIGRRLVKAGSAVRTRGGDSFTKKRRRKTIGQTLWVIAGIFLVLGLINLVYTNEAVTTDLPSPGSAGYKPPPPIRAPSASFTETAPHASLASPESTPAPPIPPAPTPLEQAPLASPTPPPARASLIPPPANQTLSPSQQQALEAELASANAALQRDPSSPIAYEQRGNIYGQEKKWDLAAKDFHHALQIKSTDAPAQFDLAEIDFLQGKYDTARAEFLPLQKDIELGDVAAYKVFLCDLAAGHLDAASKELDAFDHVGTQASYYFANVAWSAYHQKPDEALGWFKSAVDIYSPSKVHLYGTSLFDLGYLPKPPQDQ